MTETKPRLISFELCPYVQRSVILLKKKSVDFDIEYIDLDNRPEWFMKISPFGQVPVLQIGEHVLFESAVIAEYLDEVNPPSLQPADPLQKAYNRAWTEFASSLFGNVYQMSLQASQEQLDTHLETLRQQLHRVEEQIRGPYFNGEALALVDVNFAPLFTRLAIIQRQADLNIIGHLPKVDRWATKLLSLTEVQQSVPEGFEQKFLAFIRNKKGALAERMGR